MGRKKTWRWRVADPSLNPALGLLYEPGNWGDVLKGEWAVRAARAIIRMGPPGVLRVADPYAGFAAYPLVDAARARVEALPGCAFSEVERSFIEAGTLASTTGAIRAAAAAEGAAAEVSVFDADPARLASWSALEGTSTLPLASGEEIVSLLPRLADAPHLVLIDPYDFFHRFELFLPAIASAAERSAILFYAYDKSPRGPGESRVSLALHREMESAFAERGGHLVGRLPADAGLARAYHEVFLAGPPPLLRRLAPDLRESTRLLARHLADQGSFEEKLSGP